VSSDRADEPATAEPDAPSDPAAERDASSERADEPATAEPDAPTDPAAESADKPDTAADTSGESDATDSN
jgi:hypothetical protein